jgi:hypothetical protein
VKEEWLSCGTLPDDFSGHVNLDWVFVLACFGDWLGSKPPSSLQFSESLEVLISMFNKKTGVHDAVQRLSEW